MPASGDKKMASKKRIPTTTAVNPVRPPTETPEVLSINAVTDDVPMAEPATELKLST